MNSGNKILIICWNMSMITNKILTSTNYPPRVTKISSKPIYNLLYTTDMTTKSLVKWLRSQSNQQDRYFNLTPLQFSQQPSLEHFRYTLRRNEWVVTRPDLLKKQNWPECTTCLIQVACLIQPDCLIFSRESRASNPKL